MRNISLNLALLITLALTKPLSFGADWPSITDSDRSFNSVPQQSAPPAVILNREQTDDNMNNSQIVYERIKILSEAGRKYATIDLPYGRSVNISELKGRTVHADGSITPFAGKAVETARTGADGIPFTVETFTLPDAEPGSILDFRYTLHYTDDQVSPPEWEVQTDLFQRNAYFKFIPMQNRGYASVQLDHGQLARNLAWTPLLGNGAKPEIHTLPSKSNATPHDVLLWVDLKMTDVPALIEEPFMPPPALLKWRVYFYYQTTLKPEEYWKNEEKLWKKDVEMFLGKDDGVAAAVSKVVSPGDTPEQKLQKIYAFVDGLKNASRDPAFAKHKAYPLEYTSPDCIMSFAGFMSPLCVHKPVSAVEQKKQTRVVADVLLEGGTHDELNRLFIAMVHAADLPGSLLWVADRSQQAFLKDFLSIDQLDGEIAVVQLNGKDVFLDPGTKFCPYGIIDWRYSAAMGLRQNPTDTEFGQTPSLNYQQSVITRKADLVLDPSGALTGTVSLEFKRIPAMLRRQLGETADSDLRKGILSDELTCLLHGSAEVELVNSPDWIATGAPLVAQFRVRTTVTASANQELLLPLQVFHAGEKPWFPGAARLNAIDFRYPWQEADEVHVTLPAGVPVAKMAQNDSLSLPYALYRVQHKQESANLLYARRDFIMGAGLLLPEKYKELKDFFDKIASDDAQTTLLTLPIK